MKVTRIISLVLALIMLCTACGSKVGNDENAPTEEKRVFVDSCGREVLVDKEITKVALSGTLAQIVVFALAPEKMVGLVSEWDSMAKEYLATEYYQMPVIGQLYGGKGEINLEELLAVAPQLVIDIGEAKDGMAEDLDALQQQTGIPFVHIDAYLDNTAEMFRIVGDLLGAEEQAEKLATYWTTHFDMVNDILDEVGESKADLLYIAGDEGLNVIANGAYHSEVIDMFSNNIAIVENPSSKGTGNEVDMEQLLMWNPQYLIFDSESIYDQVAERPEWQNMDAVKAGRYYEVPAGPYSWLGFPPSVQRILGMMWMEQLFYPEYCDFDLKAAVTEYYSLFYHCELTDVQYEALVANSLGKVE